MKASFEQQGETLILKNGNYRLEFSPLSGWRRLVFLSTGSDPAGLGGKGTDLVHPRETIGIEVNADGRWLSLAALPEYGGFHMEDDEEVSWLAIIYRFGPLEVEVFWGLHRESPLLLRKVRLRNVGTPGAEPLLIKGIRYHWPGLGVGSPTETYFEAPGSPESLTCQPVAELTIGCARFEDCLDKYDEAFEKGALDGGRFSNAMDIGAGIFGLHNSNTGLAAAAWFHSPTETASLVAGGDQLALGRLNLTYTHRIAGWLGENCWESGTLYFSAGVETWPELIGKIQLAGFHAEVKTPGDRPEIAGQMVIYEASALAAGGFKALERRLPRLARMGINCIYLLPFWPNGDLLGDQPRDLSISLYGSPYAIEDHNRVNSALGTGEELGEFIRAAHGQGIRVLFDLVIQGIAATHPMVKEKPGWFVRDEFGRISSSHGWLDTRSLDWRNPEVRNFFIDFALRQVIEYDCDGFRVDAPMWKEPNWGPGLPYRASETELGALDLLGELRRRLHAVKPDALLFSELWGPLWHQVHDFVHDHPALVMLNRLGREEITATQFRDWLVEDGWAGPRDGLRVFCAETHDTGPWRPSPMALRGSLAQRALLGICSILPGIPLIYQGQEEWYFEFLQELLAVRQRIMAEMRLKDVSAPGRAGWCWHGPRVDDPNVFSAWLGLDGIPGNADTSGINGGARGFLGLVNVSSVFRKVRIHWEEELNATEIARLFPRQGYFPPAEKISLASQRLVEAVLAPYGVYVFSLKSRS